MINKILYFNYKELKRTITKYIAKTKNGIIKIIPTLKLNFLFSSVSNNENFIIPLPMRILTNEDMIDKKTRTSKKI